LGEFILEWIPENKILISLTSILINVVISISGFLPSAFLTAVNITVFGFKLGLLLSIIGEAIGAVISFILYRKGLSKLSNKVEITNRLLVRLKHSQGMGAAFLVLILRILPFVPSGAVTVVASYSKMSVYAFGIVSTIGKVPSLFMEAYAVNHALNFSTNWQLISFLVIILFFTMYIYWKKRQNVK
jgi:uncharacterized membrane protein YdjX (TVP38/TMEM64 family)